MKQRTFHNDQRGVVSFFVVIFISVLLVIISTGFVRIMVAEQRRAIEDDLANRALFAAETGAEDAIVEIRKRISEDKTLGNSELGVCKDKQLSPETSYDISYSCQIIESDIKNLTFELPVEGSREIDLSEAPGLSSVLVEWHVPSEDGTPISNTTLNRNISPVDWKNNGFPALMRINAFSYPVSPTGFSQGDIGNDVIFAYPVSNNSSPIDLNIQNVSSGAASCFLSTTGDAFACKAKITGLRPNTNTIIKLTSLQRGAHVQFTALDGANQPINLPGNVYSIDSTGKAGDVLRRVRVSAQFTSSGAGGTSAGNVFGRNFVITDQSICKDFGYDNSNGTATDLSGCD